MVIGLRTEGLVTSHRTSYGRLVPCLACSEPSETGVCARCRGSLRPASERVVVGILVRSAFAHDGVAPGLVHRLKYEASPVAARVLARSMVGLIPGDTAALIPVPRVLARRLRYGVDQSRELTRALSLLTGLPVVDALKPAVWTARRAGPAGRRRGTPTFQHRGAVPSQSVLVDDVITTGTTIVAAGRVVGATRAVTFTSAIRP